MAERWLPVPIPGYECLYEVSDLGRVRSRVTGKLLIPTGKRYLKVTLTGPRQITPAVHRLVLGAFAGPCPAGREARHGPGGKRDNRLINLSYGTRLDNSADKVRDGTHIHGTLSVNSKLTEAVVRRCRERYAAGDGTTVSLAAEFGVSQHAMWLAVNRRSWKHVAA